MTAEDFRRKDKDCEKVYESVSAQLDGPDTVYIEIINQDVKWF
jgi:hypothetical protein